MGIEKNFVFSGFGRRRRRALRELLKQTVEFIVPYQYQYQNQYSCSPPPLFMLCISLLQVLSHFFLVSALLRNYSLCWDRWNGTWHLHLTRPCLIALGRVLKVDPAFCIGNCNITFWLLNDRYTILRPESNPPRQSEVCYQTTALPPSHHAHTPTNLIYL